MKKILNPFFLLFFFFLFFSSVSAKKSDYSYLEGLNFDELSSVKAQNILLYNLNDKKIVYKENSNEKIAIASLTKIMTSIVTLSKVDNLEEKITIPKGAFYNTSGYAEAGFKMGDRVTIRDLLYGTLLPSGVEAAQALAIYVSGSVEAFVTEMNLLAEEIGMQNTHYSNPVGRDDVDNYSTLEDISKLLLYALENEIFYEIYTTRTYTTTNHLELFSTLVSPSKRYGLDVSYIKGSKSGYTNQAGLCLSSLAVKDGISYLLIVANSLYANGFPNHIVDSIAIYDYFFDNFLYHGILKKDQTIITLDIEDGFDKTYTITSDKDITMYVKEEMLTDIQYDYEGIKTLNYKVKLNDKLGTVKVKYQEDVLYSYDIYLKENIRYRYTKFIFGVSILAIVFFILFKLKKQKKKSRRRKKVC